MAAGSGTLPGGPTGGAALPGMTGEHDSMPPGPPGDGGESSQSPAPIFSTLRVLRDRLTADLCTLGHHGHGVRRRPSEAAWGSAA